VLLKPARIAAINMASAPAESRRQIVTPAQAGKFGASGAIKDAAFTPA
jgi:hypothetical protein